MILSDFIEKVKRRTVGLQLTTFKQNTHYFTQKKGLEIGGPSTIFRRDQILPVYSIANQVDGVNFSTQTVWENKIEAGQTYRYDSGKLGRQYILEASDLSAILDDSYDFLVASHSLEHCANVFKTVIEWKRVVKEGGGILIVVPNPDYTFDCKRQVTTFEHLVEDFESHVDEHDLTHLNEIISLHDIIKDKGVNDVNQLKERSLLNYENRCLHHHVFNAELLKKIFTYIGMKIIFTDFYKPYHTIILVEK